MTANPSRTDADGLLARIEAMKTLCEAATSGEWTVDSDPGDWEHHGYCHVEGWTDRGEDWMNLDMADATFIAAHSPDTMPVVWSVAAAAQRLVENIREADRRGIPRFPGYLDQLEQALLALAARLGGTK